MYVYLVNRKVIFLQQEKSEYQKEFENNFSYEQLKIRTGLYANGMTDSSSEETRGREVTEEALNLLADYRKYEDKFYQADEDDQKVRIEHLRKIFKELNALGFIGTDVRNHK